MSGEGRGRGLTHRELFAIFLQAGLAFGGGLGVLAVLEHELVARRGLVSREEFLTDYALARIVPSGTMTALAVAYGHRFGGIPGTVVALTALVLPAFATTLGLTLAYVAIRDGPALGWLSFTLLPATLALIVVAALRLGREVFRPGRPLAIALAAFALAAGAKLSPIVLLVLGGAAGAILLRDEPPQ
jgi:chromate transporter